MPQTKGISKRIVFIPVIVSFLTAILVYGVFATTEVLRGAGDVASKAPEFTPWVWKKISVRAVGDFMPHGSVIKSALAHQTGRENKSGFAYLFRNVMPLIQSGDVNMVNFETPCSPSKFKSTRSYVFNVDPASIDALHDGGFNLFLLANNHMYDQGRKGFLETLNEFDKRKLRVAGVAKNRKMAEKPVIIPVNKARLAVWNVTQFVNENFNHRDSSWVNVYDGQNTLKQVAAWRDSADVTIFVYHGGDEYSNKPTRRKKEFFKKLIDAGVLVIISHHPHVPQPIEWVETEKGNTGLVFYSLGNFLGNQSRKYRPLVSQVAYGDTRDVLIASFDLCLMDYGPLGKKWTVQNAGVIPCWTENNYTQALKGAPRDIHLVSNFHAMDALNGLIDSLSRVMQVDSLKKTAAPALKKAVEMKRHFLRRNRRISHITGDEFVINPLRLK